MYSEKTVIDQITILEDGQIQIREATKVFKDGVEISETYWRGVIAPDKDLATLTITPNTTVADLAKVKAVAGVVWIKEVKDKFILTKQQNERGLV